MTTATISEKHQLQALRVLLVDDSEDDYTICAYRLQKASPIPFKFTWAGSADIAKEIYGHEQFDCVICDYQMPGEDGLSFLKWMRNIDPITPFVFFTGQGNEQIAAQALKDGANDYFTKNHEFAQFERLANSIFSNTQTSKRNKALRKVEATIARIDNESSYLTGEEYLIKMCELLCNELGFPHCFVGEIDHERFVLNTTAYFSFGERVENQAFEIAGTPCEQVITKYYFSVGDGVQSEFPQSELLGDLEARSYIGVSLFDSSAKVVGLLSLIHTEEFEHTNLVRSLLTTLAARAGVELERLKFVETLKQNQSFLNSILQDQTDLIVRFKPNGKRTFANKAYCAFVGWSEEAIFGTSVFDDISSENGEALRSRIQELTPQNPSVQTKREMRDATGKLCHIEWTDRALYDEHGNLLEVQSVGRDISERVAAKKHGASMETLSNAIFKAAGEPMFILKDGKFIDANPKSEELFKAERADMIGMGPHDFSPKFQKDGELSLDKAGQMIRKSAEGAHTFDWRHQDSEGNLIDATVTLSRMTMDGEYFVLAIVRALNYVEEETA
jgi:PAS domain S-box-containing protein